ncbi:MAG TPA: AarF/UbiB family protein [Terriglobales bacterium]|nr:AarF/UbiB family protein [Terriglobales bacterium]
MKLLSHPAGKITSRKVEWQLPPVLPLHGSIKERSAALVESLNSPIGPMLRQLLAKWIADQAVPAARLVPKRFENWLPVVRDAMCFVVLNLSADRLAPKIIQQLDLPPRTRIETRLLLLIAKVPGLQKLGQIVARNRHLGRALRRSLVKLENGIRDVEAGEVQRLIRRQLGQKLEDLQVRMRPTLLSEASVSAIVRFTWKQPGSAVRRAGVFKVLKPYIPSYFKEDLQLLQGLTEHFGSRLDQYGFAADALADTFGKVRRLLAHEVDFWGEQRTLSAAAKVYASTPNVRVPHVIAELCTDSITAITEEKGAKVTDCGRLLSRSEKKELARRVIDAFVIVPLFSPDEQILFHADPHAGNILYDRATRKLVILDWALTESLNRSQRRNLGLLLFYFALRDPLGTTRCVLALASPKRSSCSRKDVLELVSGYLEDMKLSHLPSSVDAMRLLEWLTAKGVRFPSPLIMLSKVLFTLDGVLHDLGVDDLSIGNVVCRHLLARSVRSRHLSLWPLRSKDLIYLHASALLYPARMWIGIERATLKWLVKENVQSSV